ncbi:no pollen germination related 1 [Euphorbia peplus]|nr:no pollen germination related 1 [Euphorbia peplus]
MKLKSSIKKLELGIGKRLWKMMKCIRSGEQLRVDDMADSSESLASRDYSASEFSSRTGEIDAKMDNNNIEEAESSLRESGYLNYEVSTFCFALCFMSFVFCSRFRLL